MSETTSPPNGILPFSAIRIWNFLEYPIVIAGKTYEPQPEPAQEQVHLSKQLSCPGWIHDLKLDCYRVMRSDVNAKLPRYAPCDEALCIVPLHVAQSPLLEHRRDLYSPSPHSYFHKPTGTMYVSGLTMGLGASKAWHHPDA